MKMEKILIVTLSVIVSSHAFTLPIYVKRLHSGGPSSGHHQMLNNKNIQQHQQYYDFNMAPSNAELNYQYNPIHDQQNKVHVYGQPVYRGNYNPTPYYYAQPPSYNFYDDRSDIPSNPMDYLHEKMIQEDELQRMQELSPELDADYNYESITPPRASQDDYTKNFLRNLMSYNNRGSYSGNIENSNQPIHHMEPTFEYDDYPEAELDYFYQPNENNYDQQKYDKIPADLQYNSEIIPRQRHHIPDDKEVRELKSLIKNNQNKNYEKSVVSDPYNEMHQDEPAQYDTPEYDDTWINWDSKRSVDLAKQKPKVMKNDKIIATSTVQPSATVGTTVSKTDDVPTTPLTVSNEKYNGQKEVVLPRPATPVKQPFAAPVMEMLKNSPMSYEIGTHKSSFPTVYESIRQLMTMEENLENVSNTFIVFFFVLILY